MRCKYYGAAELGRFWKPREDRQDGIAIVGVVRCSTAPNCTGCGDDLRYAPDALPRMDLAAAGPVRLGRLVHLGRPWPRLCQEPTSARARLSTLAYVEKVRPQFLSLRQEFI
jgi:hypothetical protein